MSSNIPFFSLSQLIGYFIISFMSMGCLYYLSFIISNVFLFITYVFSGRHDIIDVYLFDTSLWLLLLTYSAICFTVMCLTAKIMYKKKLLSRKQHVVLSLVALSVLICNYTSIHLY